MGMEVEEIKGTPMKAGDFRPCALCGKGVMHTGLPLFYRVTIQRMGVDAGEVQRSHGMEQFFGGAVALARAFHDPDIARPITEQQTVLICESCSTEAHLIAQLPEAADRIEARRKQIRESQAS